MAFPSQRLRRFRRLPELRRMVRETRVSAQQLILPLFVEEGLEEKVPIKAMPGQFRHSLDSLVEEAKLAKDSGLGGIILFGIPAEKDEGGTGAYDPKGIVPQAISRLRKEVQDLVLMADVCLCEYTSHGHCGVLKDGQVQNDISLELVARTATMMADAGAHVVAPSDMMDGRVGAVRASLDAEGHPHIPILSYAAKYASAFYGPFRQAADSAPAQGDRKGYQMDPANAREALREMRLDAEEGADALMVKPGLAYLDVLSAARREFDLPLAAYNVSGEYSMVKAASSQGWMDEKAVVEEILTGFARAGADMILTYHALDAAGWLGNS